MNKEKLEEIKLWHRTVGQGNQWIFVVYAHEIVPELVEEIERLKRAYTWHDATIDTPDTDRLVLIQRSKGDLGERVTTGYYVGPYWWAFDDARKEHHPAYRVTDPVTYWCELPMKDCDK